jgi:hypothetical protein
LKAPSPTFASDEMEQLQEVIAELLEAAEARRNLVGDGVPA